MYILSHSVNLAFGLNRAPKMNVGPRSGLFRALQHEAHLQLWVEVRLKHDVNFSPPYVLRCVYFCNQQAGFNLTSLCFRNKFTQIGFLETTVAEKRKNWKRLLWVHWKLVQFGLRVLCIIQWDLLGREFNLKTWEVFQSLKLCQEIRLRPHV